MADRDGSLAEAERRQVVRSLRAARQRLRRGVTAERHNGSMAKRSYGSGSLFVKHGKWYGRWWIGDQRVKRALGQCVRQAVAKA